MLNMIHNLNHGILSPTTITIPFHHHNIPLPPRRVINLIHPVVTGIQQVLGIHDIIEPGVDRDISGQVDDLDVDLLEVGAGGGVGVLDVEGVGDVGVEDLGQGLLVLTIDLQLLISIHRHIIYFIPSRIHQNRIRGTQINYIIQRTHRRVS